MKRVAVLQSNYIPWKGYFDIIHDADVFIFYDDVQFTKNDWRNRNKIKSSNGTNWLSIPVGSDLHKLVCETPIPDMRWAKKHWLTIEQFYGKAPYFKTYREFFETVYKGMQWDNLSTLNQFIIRGISIDLLGIGTQFDDSRHFVLQGRKNDRLLDLVSQSGADVYISGPAARDYIDEQSFAAAGISIVYKDYAGYPEYPQFYPPFTHYVSILDLLFQTGPDAPYYIWGWREERRQPASEPLS